jgi:hypothetical protein
MFSRHVVKALEGDVDKPVRSGIEVEVGCGACDAITLVCFHVFQVWRNDIG